MIKQTVLALMVLLLVGCHAKKSVIVTQKTDRYTDKYNKKAAGTAVKLGANDWAVNDYIANYKEVAMRNMKNYGIPASIILAQGILESGAGRSTLATTANNHFGIKCHADWKGESVFQDDDAAQECFRKYKEAADSFKDHATFLTGRNRYASLFNLPKGDYEAWAKGLRAAGYATDTNYPQKLISFIERYELYQYDDQALGNRNRRKIAEKTTENQSDADYEVQKGDTLFSISKKFNISVEDLQLKNNLIDNTLYIGQKLRIK